MQRIVIFSFLVLILGSGCESLSPMAKVEALPENSPQAFLEKGKSESSDKIMVCIGDSITHGTVSVNYVDMLTERLGPKGYELINAGINGNLAYDVTQRMDEIIACAPDVVTILIGTNDAYGSMSEKLETFYVDKNKLPQKPTEDFYRKHLVEICRRVKNETNAKVFLLSLPPLSETFTAPAFLRAKKYSRIVKEIAEAEGVVFIDLHEKMTDVILSRGGGSLEAPESDKFLDAVTDALVSYAFFGKSLDEISAEKGFLVLTDYLHLNSTGAGIVADCIENAVLGSGF